MTIKQTLQIICDYIESNRRIGHTTAMIRGAQNVDNVLIVAANSHDKEILQRKIPSADIIAISGPACMIGKNKAIAIDNYALWKICRDSLEEIKRLEARIQQSLTENPSKINLCPKNKLPVSK